MNTRHQQIKRVKPLVDSVRRKELYIELQKYIRWDGNNGVLVRPNMPKYLNEVFEEYRQHIEDQKRLYPRYSF